MAAVVELPCTFGALQHASIFRCRVSLIRGIRLLPKSIPPDRRSHGLQKVTTSLVRHCAMQPLCNAAVAFSH